MSDTAVPPETVGESGAGTPRNVSPKCSDLREDLAANVHAIGAQGRLMVDRFRENGHQPETQFDFGDVILTLSVARP